MADENVKGKENKTPSTLNDYIPDIGLRQFTQALLSEEVLGNKTKAQEITGVSKGKFYWHYQKNPKFRKWHDDQIEEYFRRNGTLVASSLMNKIKAGDVAAIKLYYELAGRLKPGINLAINNDMRQPLIIVAPGNTIEALPGPAVEVIDAPGEAKPC